MTTVVEVRPAGERPLLVVPRDDALVREVADGDGFACAEGPFREYRRHVRDRQDGGVEVTATFTVRPAFWGLLFVPGMRRRLTRPPAGSPWWAPPERLDRRGAEVVGLLCSISVVGGYLGTVITQTATFAANEFEATTSEQSRLLAAVRASILLVFVLTALIDRIGRRPLVGVCAGAGCVITATGALAPGMLGLGITQAVARGFSGTLTIIVVILLAEEMPGGSRAWGYSVISLCQALGAGICLWVLPIADVGPDGSPWWRVVYVVPLVFLPVVAIVRRHLPESRRFEVPHVEAPIAGHGRRFWLLAVTLFALALFATPVSQLGNDFLEEQRGFSAGGISLFTVLTATPAFFGIVIGGRLADTHGRRIVATVAIAGGTVLAVVAFASAGPALWWWSIAQNIIAAATIPAMGMYRAELFPTSLRGRAAGGLEAMALAGAVTGLLVVGSLVDRGWSYGEAFAAIAPVPLLVAGLVLIAFPETAHHTLEDLNPEDEVAVLAREDR